jgi:hypothetical protein
LSIFLVNDVNSASVTCFTLESKPKVVELIEFAICEKKGMLALNGASSR